jgi:hypothetical protein
MISIFNNNKEINRQVEEGKEKEQELALAMLRIISQIKDYSPLVKLNLRYIKITTQKQEVLVVQEPYTPKKLLFKKFHINNWQYSLQQLQMPLLKKEQLEE